MCRNPVGFLGLLGFLGLSGFICFFGFVNLRLFVCMCVWVQGKKSVKYPLFCHF